MKNFILRLLAWAWLSLAACICLPALVFFSAVVIFVIITLLALDVVTTGAFGRKIRPLSTPSHGQSPYSI